MRAASSRSARVKPVSMQSAIQDFPIVREEEFKTLEHTDLLRRIIAEHLAGIYINHGYLDNANRAYLHFRKVAGHEKYAAILREPLDNKPDESDVQATVHWLAYCGMVQEHAFYQTSDAKVLDPVRKLYKQAAKLGSALGKYYQARYLRHYNKARRRALLSEASRQGCLPATYYLARWERVANSRELLQQLIDAGYARAMSYTAATCPSDQNELYARAAALGDRDGCSSRGAVFPVSRANGAVGFGGSQSNVPLAAWLYVGRCKFPHPPPHPA